MGVLDWFRKPKPMMGESTTSRPAARVAVGATDKDDVSITFNNKNITFTGDLTTYDYDKILRQKQQNIYRLFE